MVDVHICQMLWSAYAHELLASLDPGKAHRVQINLVFRILEIFNNFTVLGNFMT